ncbi:hypothetical protein CSAL01_11673 [Colletotrichum salicis]|uniref:Uncharacterized protein n=1 Tax=Colletotrichum salicis TaxID=1209931 RepID=A0A135TRB4_9PEZI|nr:hypothetical protein CSAL01_11673 [Colletotrichum salicis]
MESPADASVKQSLATAIWADNVGDGASSTRHLRSAQLLDCYMDQFSTVRSFDDERIDDRLDRSRRHRSGFGVCGAANVYDRMSYKRHRTRGDKPHEWKSNETLASFLNRVYPQAFAEGTQDQSISIGNLAAHILSKNSGVDIVATDTMSDHLSLIQREGFKTLLVFHHRAFLEHSLEVLKADKKDLSHTKLEALSLDPENPRPPISPFDDGQSRRMLKKWVQREDLDPDVLKPCFHSLEYSADKDTPKDLDALYTQFPHWAQRLTRLLEEVDDPTPTTRWERYAERRKSPRHMYKCAIAAFIVAEILGILATMLAAVQVWISYCDWGDDPEKPLCGAAKKTSTPRL